MLTINNMSAQFAASMINNINAAMQKNQTNLTTGKRINSAADGAAAFTISSQFETQLSAIKAAQDNVSNGTNLVSTAESSIDTIQKMLVKAQTLALSSSDNSSDANAKAANDTELQDILTSIDRIANNTKFGTTSLLDGTFTNKNLQIGTAAADTYSLSISSMKVAGLALTGVAVDTDAHASAALTKIQTALDTVTQERGKLGNVVNNVLNVQQDTLAIQYQNIKSANTTISSTDMAAEQSAYTANQTRLQIAMAMLSQSNQMNGLVLNLFK